jgi:hypothetical protein
MGTILYNTTYQQVIGHFENGYIVDGKPQPVNPPIFELTVIEIKAPETDATKLVSSEWVVDLIAKTYTLTWSVRDKTEAELIAEKEAEANEADQTFSVEEAKKLLRMRADSLTEDELYQFPSVYPAWRPGEALKNAADSATGKADIRQYKGKLYKVVLSHTTQIDWLPDVSASLFTAFNPPETISVFVQPTGAHDVYMKGDKVHFPTASDPVYESLIDNNSWSPIAYPQGWSQL